MFIPKQRKKIVQIFLRNPFDEVHLRKIAELSEVSVNNVSKSMELYVEEGLFLRRDVSGMAFFKPDLSNETMLKLFEYLELERKNEFYVSNKQVARMLKDYTDKLVKLSGGEIQLVILFGSVARGQWVKNSDVDILTVSAKEDKSMPSILTKAKEDISPLLRISPVNTTIEKFKAGLEKKTEFYEELFRDRIILYNEFLFWSLIAEGVN
ncbi:MAG: nucleotidyltransferase domain-containing protein [Elusimicrobiota bacterium]